MKEKVGSFSQIEVNKNVENCSNKIPSVCDFVRGEEQNNKAQEIVN
jgi:hypothetical protein